MKIFSKWTLLFNLEVTNELDDGGNSEYNHIYVTVRETLVIFLSVAYFKYLVIVDNELYNIVIR